MAYWLQWKRKAAVSVITMAVFLNADDHCSRDGA